MPELGLSEDVFAARPETADDEEAPAAEVEAEAPAAEVEAPEAEVAADESPDTDKS
jgi:hypothetical protein